LGLVALIVDVRKEVGILLPDQVKLAEAEVVEDLNGPQEVGQGDGHVLRGGRRCCRRSFCFCFSFSLVFRMSTPPATPVDERLERVLDQCQLSTEQKSRLKTELRSLLRYA